MLSKLIEFTQIKLPHCDNTTAIPHSNYKYHTPALLSPHTSMTRIVSLNIFLKANYIFSLLMLYKMFKPRVYLCVQKATVHVIPAVT